MKTMNFDETIELIKRFSTKLNSNTPVKIENIRTKDERIICRLSFQVFPNVKS